MRDVAQPFTRAPSGEPYSSATRWRTVGDITSDTYYFESTTSPNLIWVDLKQVDFTRPQRLDLVNFPDRVGNVTEQFEAKPLFEAAPPM